MKVSCKPNNVFNKSILYSIYWIKASPSYQEIRIIRNLSIKRPKRSQQQSKKQVKIFHKNSSKSKRKIIKKRFCCNIFLATGIHYKSERLYNKKASLWNALTIKHHVFRKTISKNIHIYHPNSTFARFYYS